MDSDQPNNPLHGVTLELIVTRLVEHYGWPELAERVPIHCFQNEPSVRSSLKFLRRMAWARSKVEALYVATDLRSSAEAPRAADRRSGAQPARADKPRASTQHARVVTSEPVPRAQPRAIPFGFRAASGVSKPSARSKPPASGNES